MIDRPARERTAGKRRKLRSYQKSLLLMSVPGILFFLIYKYYPMYGVLIAFLNGILERSLTFLKAIDKPSL